MTTPRTPEERPQGTPSADETPATSEAIVRLRDPRAIAPAWALLTYTVESGVWRRSLYLSLHSAARAGERAKMRGQKFKMILVELVPVASTPPRRRAKSKRP